MDELPLYASRRVAPHEGRHRVAVSMVMQADEGPLEPLARRELRGRCLQQQAPVRPEELGEQPALF